MSAIEIDLDALQRENSKRFWYEAFTQILCYAIFGALFGYFTEEPEYYAPCSTLSSSYHWGRISYVFYLVGLVLGGCVAPLLTYTQIRVLETGGGSYRCVGHLVTLIRFGLGVAGLTCFGGLANAFDQGEDCGKLTTLILAYIILFSIGMGIACIVGLLMICCAQALVSTLTSDAALEKMAKQIEKEMNLAPTKTDNNV